MRCWLNSVAEVVVVYGVFRVQAVLRARLSVFTRGQTATAPGTCTQADHDTASDLSTTLRRMRQVTRTASEGDLLEFDSIHGEDSQFERCYSGPRTDGLMRRSNGGHHLTSSLENRPLEPPGIVSRRQRLGTSRHLPPSDLQVFM